MTDEIQLVDDSRIERHIWKQIGKQSAREMATALGVPPEKILAIKRDMVESVDELTIQVQKTKLMTSLQEIADDAQEAFEHADYEFKAGLLNSSIAAIKALLVELNRTSKQDSEAINSLNRLRINELLRLIDITVARTLEEIATEYGLDEEELLGIFQKHLKPAAEELDS